MRAIEVIIAQPVWTTLRFDAEIRDATEDLICDRFKRVPGILRFLSGDGIAIGRSTGLNLKPWEFQ